MTSASGVININKPAGMTSHDVVYRVRKIASQKRVGHAGTLDPDATGVLLVCLGHATRLADLLAEQGKEYEAVLRLGQATTTEDASGALISETDPSGITERDLANVLPRFIGSVSQIPPMVSAVHHQGQRLYELARKGITVEREPRVVNVESIEMTGFTSGAGCQVSLRVKCGKGTYIRTLCADIGAALGVGGHMSTLRRMAVGRFTIDSAVPLDALHTDNWYDYLFAAGDAVDFLKAVQMDETQAADVLNGKRIDTGTRMAAGNLVRLERDSLLLALARVGEDGLLQPEKVFPPI